MKIDDTLISKLERLSKLELAVEEKKEIKNDLNEILQMVETLQELDTDNVEPLIYVNQDKHPERQDVVANELSVEEATVNSPIKNENGFFTVPKVLDK